eukprot:CAMPEP_0181213322 /NCGR_PEP_ID=MMETSP1096-20121128/24837_1 /TAXON_ID=156174 ORGANISM="Chrysochromulina ericina, Strain CCMP281" /NCGR_SAMPLE_ID=MMETSP1096 /ASSEMBLY_ACC=CAM_ASM_000453 /LENGTH=240 /DNA_ID=CAMNT_0023304941 /DNA_START=193 /DNA_END=912 /DNA_ORIENTATION=+
MVGFSKILAQRRQNKAWRYIEYDSLKHLIGVPVPEFFSVLCHEIEEVDVSFTALLRNFEAAYPGCEAIGAAELRDLAMLNYLAVLKIAKKYDKSLHRRSMGSGVLERVEAVLFRSGFCKTLLGSTLFAQETRSQPTTDDFVVWEQLVEARSPKRSAFSFLPPVQEEGGDWEEEQATMLFDCCPICIEQIHDAAVLPCTHRFCWACLANCAAHGMDVCPICRATHSLDPVNVAVDSMLGVL